MEKTFKESEAVSTADTDPQVKPKYKILRSRIHHSTLSASCQSWRYKEFNDSVLWNDYETRKLKGYPESCHELAKRLL